jgi:hypothetical protein
MRRFSIKIACAAAFLLACASALSASDTTFVHQGARVKVFPSGAKPVTGEVAKLAYDTMVILPEAGAKAVTFLRQDFRRIEMVQGGKSNWAKGGLIGFGAGAVAGSVFWLSVREEDDSDVDTVLLAGALGGIGGAALGALIGAFIKSDRWVDAQMPVPPPVSFNVGKDGSVRLAFSLRL